MSENPPIIVKSKASTISDYPQQVYKLLARTEPRHFWFAAKNKIIGTTITKFLPDPGRTRFLEIGCGTGFVLSYLEKLGFSMTGVDMHMEGLRIAQSRITKGSLICADVTRDVLGQPFPALGLFDVLEHIEDDIYFLQRCVRHLAPRGLVFITVPADMRLWSIIDEVSGHKRRYSKKTLEKLLTLCGLKIETISYFNTFLYLAQLFSRKQIHTNHKLTKKSTVNILLYSFRYSPLINTIGTLGFTLEFLLSGFFPMPFGASLVVAARKGKG